MRVCDVSGRCVRVSIAPIPVIETERLVLHPLDPSDADEMVGVLADEKLYDFIGGAPPDLAALRHRYRSQVAGPAAADESWCNWIVRDSADGRAIGFVQATVIDRTADVAWLIGVGDQSRGVAAEAARAMCGWLVAQGIERLRAHVHPRHVASQRVAARIGLILTDEVDNDGEEIWASPSPVTKCA